MFDAPILTEALFVHYPWDDSPKMQQRIADQEFGPHWFYRRVKAPIRERFHQLMDNNTIPRAVLFGSPHIDNYAKTDTGCGMIDFDRAYVGPYAWDLVCFILSVSLRQTEQRFSIIDQSVLDALLTGYNEGLSLGEAPFAVYEPLASLPPKNWQQSVEAYIKKNKKWAKKMNKFPVPADDLLMNELVGQYLQNLQDSQNPQDYRLQQAGRCLGTFDRVHNILLIEHLPTNTLSLVDIKHTRSYCNPNWPHDQFYTSKYQHDGVRMIAASHLHAPNVTSNESYATINGIQYWGRAVPLQNDKIKHNLDHQQQLEFCYAVATQLGRSHGLSGDRSQIQAHLTEHFTDIVAVCTKILAEFSSAWQYYLQMLNQED